MIELLVNIDVDDLGRGIAFYRDGLGLTLRRMLFDGRVAELAGGPCPVYLLAKPAGGAPASTIAAPRDYGPHWTPVHLEVAVARLADAIGRATRAGAVQEGDITSHPWGRLAVLRDPFGHGFCLIEFSTGGYDAVADPPSA